MLGKLAKWLRVLGYDTLYQSSFRPGVIDLLLKEGRYLLSRRQEAIGLYKNMIFLQADRVGAQLEELRGKVNLAPERSGWFTRCLLCNTVLTKAKLDELQDNVPEYVFFNNMQAIHSCPSCGRYYWPGSHRTRMIRQLEAWGFF